MKFLTSFCLFILPFFLLSQPNIEWKKNYGGSGEDHALEILKTQNGYFISGSTTSQDGDFVNNPDSLSYFILKIDLTGDIEWINYYPDRIIATAKDYKEDLVFIKAIDIESFHIEQLNKQGTTIFSDTILSVERTIIPRDIAESEDGKFKIVGDLFEDYPRDGVFNCTYEIGGKNPLFNYLIRFWTGGINNYRRYYAGIVEFQGGAAEVGYLEFNRTGEKTNFPSQLEDCYLWPGTKLVSCPDGSFASLWACQGRFNLSKAIVPSLWTISFPVGWQ